ncbi:MAG TPA: LuxR family transcriptional regulator [Candidatus Binatia bacterium]|nr:LuxR family transcriptional regulator [Candidatus Binatia bacterium]
MLLGRGPELARIDRAVADAQRGVSSVLLLRGEPGIGKTALLQHALTQGAGMRVLSARGVEFEADVPFAGLHELLRPALGLLDRIPTPAAESLRAALGLGGPGEGDRLLIGAATLELLTLGAETPLIVLVDDAHWLDRASAEAIGFTARRLLADPVALLVAIREGEPSPLLGAGFEEMRLGGLDRTSAAELLRLSAPNPLGDEVAARILAASAGNPLALVEMAAEADRFESSAAPQPLPVPVATTVERAYLRRADGLSAAARNVLLLSAASGEPSMDLLARAAEELGLPSGAVVEAEAASALVEVRGRAFRFVHPLAAAAIYHAATPAEQRQAHRALATVMTAPELADRRAWHLAAASAGSDEEAAAAVEAAGERARELTGYAASRAAFEEAARLSPTPADRHRRLLAAAESAWLAAQTDRAATLLDEVRSGSMDSRLLTEADALAGRIALDAGAAESGFRLIRQAASELVESERLRAIQLLAGASLSGLGSGRLADMLATASQALELLAPDDPAAAGIAAHTAYGCAAVLGAEGDAGPRHLRAAAELFSDVDLAAEPLLILCAASVGVFLREAETGRALLEQAHAQARSRAPAAVLPPVLCYLARDLATTDQWAAARANYEEAARLARETDQHSWLAAPLAGLAQLDALEGLAADMRLHAAEARSLAERFHLDFFHAWAVSAIAMAELSEGRTREALSHLTTVSQAHRRLGILDPDVDPAPEIAEVAMRLGDREAATVAAERYHPAAVAKGQPFALARAERALGIVASDLDFEQHYQAALHHHARTRDSFETARTWLSYGERLRRARRRREARLQLSAALETFTRLGATPWTRRTLAEMGAVGAQGSRGDPAIRHRLTPQEVQIALALAEGMTTREAAAKLYLSPKTVEYHLRNVYDKLEIRSRDELRLVVGAQPG